MKHLPKMQHLNTFRQVVRSRSIRAAAREMGLSQPALSRTLRELEQTLGVQLFLRGQEGITLTEAGEAFLRRTEWILEELQRAADEVEQISHYSQGKLAVGFSSLLALTIFPALIDNFKARWPHARLNLKEGQLATLLPLLRQGELDLAIGTINPRKVPDDVVIEPLFVAPFCIIARRGHPLEQATSLNDLRRAKWLLPETNVGYYQQLQDELNEFYGQIHEQPVWTESIVCGLNMVLQSDYLTVVARAMSMPLNLQDKISVLPITTLPSAQYCVAWSQKSALTETARQFLLSLRQACQGYNW
ncbi:LysR substrate-binding domain-containing protein [Enterobacteriaceae bacterium H11S18]|uniref:LysR substrate-binding domain-containing protein n=1 Tax=Dryocola clanedunensis TaxID=2925396 RepID=UPI0022EFDA6C|nr:LysR substrate-binding domain-containing protein [Dryocola clanedunensis]MCT4705892.1 LysR substrate-binding domain-containing protein [Dryocola clanedunensis]MCT4710460.1 LysR substrate-binding domain-containing protein [Dryocola clanedunensis]